MLASVLRSVPVLESLLVLGSASSHQTASLTSEAMLYVHRSCLLRSNYLGRFNRVLHWQVQAKAYASGPSRYEHSLCLNR